MKKKKPQGICAFCRKPSSILTRDHIPPKNLDPDYTGLRTTVPACKECNMGNSKDDEYLRLTLTLDERLQDHPRVQLARDAALRGIMRPKSRKFYKAFMNQVQPTAMYSGEIYVGNRHTYNMDDLRIERTISKIIKGLFFIEFDTVLPKEYDVISLTVLTVQHLPNPQAHSDAIVQRFSPVPFKTLIDNVFQYKVSPLNTNNPNLLYWLLCFYDLRLFLGEIVPQQEADEHNEQICLNARFGPYSDYFPVK